MVWFLRELWEAITRIIDSLSKVIGAKLLLLSLLVVLVVTAHYKIAYNNSQNELNDLININTELAKLDKVTSDTTIITVIDTVYLDEIIEVYSDTVFVSKIDTVFNLSVKDSLIDGNIKVSYLNGLAYAKFDYIPLFPYSITRFDSKTIETNTVNHIPVYRDKPLKLKFGSGITVVDNELYPTVKLSRDKYTLMFAYGFSRKYLASFVVDF